MKKLIATILVLAMVLTMALTVSAAPGASLSTLMEGDYEILDPMAPPAMHAVIYELSFQKNNPSGGTLTIVDNAFTGAEGTYTFSVDANDVATITVEAGNTGNPEVVSAMSFSYDMGGNLTLRLGKATYICAPANAGSGTGPVAPTGTELTIGANVIPVTISGYYAAPVDVYFTASEAGTYVLSFAANETTGVVGIEINNESTDITLPYEFTLEAGETFEAFVSTGLNVIQNEGVTDNIDLVLTKKVDAPAGGNGGSPENGDSTALYVAVAAVALASVFGCAIVSKKRIAE